MIKICPECLNINIDSDNCNTCGFPFGKKIIGRFEDYYFYDIIDLFNMGHQKEANEKAIEKQQSITDTKLNLLIEKITMVEGLIKKAEDHSSEAQKRLQSGDLLGADQEIKAAKSIYSSARFNEIDSNIQNSITKVQISTKAKALFDDATLLLQRNANTEALQALKDAKDLCPSNLEYNNAYIKILDTIINTGLVDLDVHISEGRIADADIKLKELVAITSGDNRLHKIGEKIAHLLNTKSKKKKKFMLFIFVLGALLISAIGWVLIKNAGEKKKWETALNEGTLESIELYITENSDGKFYADATKKLAELNSIDSTSWASTQAIISAESLKNYISTVSYFNGRHLVEANAMVDSIDWFLIERTDDINLIQQYISSHPNSRYLNIAQGRISLEVGDSEKQELYQFVRGYFDLYQNKDLESVMMYYSPITPVFGPKKNITKADLRLLFESDINNITSSNYTIDQMSFKAKKDDAGNCLLTFYSDSYITRSTLNDADESSEVTLYTNMQWKIKIDSDKKIVSYNYKIISEKPINQ